MSWGLKGFEDLISHLIFFLLFDVVFSLGLQTHTHTRYLAVVFSSPNQFSYLGQTSARAACFLQYFSLLAHLR